MSQVSFIGWSEPFLPQVAKRILSEGLENARRRPGRAPSLDLGRFVYVLPGRRALRTLESYLQAYVDRAIEEGRVEPDWIPPDHVSLGDLFDRLFPQTRAVADELTRACALCDALENLDRASRALILETRQDFEELPVDEKIQAARVFLDLQDELASERCSYDRVLRAVADDLDEREKWTALRRLDALYRSRLKELGLVDRNMARAFALDSKLVGGTSFDRYNGAPREYRVVGAVDLNAMQKEFFAALGDRVQYWVFAPESEKDNFDPDFGSIVKRDLALPVEAILPDPDPSRPIPAKNFFQVDKPADQGETVAALICELASVNKGEIDREALTIGAPDEEVVPYIEKNLLDLGLNSVVAQGTSLVRNRVYHTLLDLIEYIEKRSFSALNALIRAPEVGLYIKRRAFALAGDDVDALLALDSNAFSSDRLVEDFDLYRVNYHPMRVSGKWKTLKRSQNSPAAENVDLTVRRAASVIGELLKDFWVEPYRETPENQDETETSEPKDVQRSGVDALNDPIDDMKLDRTLTDDRTLLSKGLLKLKGADDLAPEQRARSFKEWAPILSRTLCAIYEKRVPSQDRMSESSAAIDGFFRAFNKVLDSFDSASDAFGETTGATAARVALDLLQTKRVEPTPAEDPVEIQGWLDLLYDDAPNLIVTGFNERSVPGTRSPSEFISEKLRLRLGLSGPERLVDRDAYLTAALAHSRTNVYFICGRQALNGDPRQPSRFIFSNYEAPSGEVSDPIAKRVCRFFGKDDGGTLENLRARVRTRKESAELRGVDRPIDALIAKSAREDSEYEKWTARARTLNIFGLNRPLLDLRSKMKNVAMGENYPMELNATDFEKFLTSPYRYFLSRVYNLSPVEPPSVHELDARRFGTIVHEVLKEYGELYIKEKGLKEVDTEKKLTAVIERIFRRVSRRFFDLENATPFVKLQMELIRQRLARFAKWQIAWQGEGWKIMHVECAPKTEDGKEGVWFDMENGDPPVFIKGRIDRIDKNMRTGEWRVFDYKTFDSYRKGRADKKAPFKEDCDLCVFRPGNTVDIKHRKRVSDKTALPPSFADRKFCWINLQLPLYRLIFGQFLSDVSYCGSKSSLAILSQQNEKFSFGYIVLPKSDDVLAFGAPWTPDEFVEAEDVARWVVRRIRRFWREGVVDPFLDVKEDDISVLSVLDDAPLLYDDFAPLTLDYDPDRTAEIRKERARSENR